MATYSVQYQLYRVCVAIALVSVLSPGLLLLPTASAQAGSLRLTGIGEHIELAGKATATPIQLPPTVAQRLRQALSQQTHIPAATLKLVEATPKNWTNGCFDLARSGEFCTQAIVKGWRVVFSNGTQRWVYRTDQQGRSPRLEP